jgi:hypothetical protein
MTGLWAPLAEVAAVLLGAGALGYGLTGTIFSEAAGRTERAAWGFAIGLAVLAAGLPVAFLLRLPPRWTILGVALVSVGVVWILCRRAENPTPFRMPGGAAAMLTPVCMLLLALVAFGVAIYTLRALTEPMWSNDYIAIWGFKGKTIFGAGEMPKRLFTDLSLGFSHPEYPLGLPLIFAALAFLLGRWDDHAMALVFPFLQVATLLALFGWLRRRGVSRILALSATAILAQFEPLYSGFLTGMAEVPFSFGALLFGTALVDALDRIDPFARRRLVLATVLVVSTKNEGLLLALVGLLIALFSRVRFRSVRKGAVVAVAVPALLLLLAGRLWKGNPPFRDFEFAYLGPTLIMELLPRVAEAIHTAVGEVILPSWAGLACVLVLFATGGRSSAGDRLLVLSGVCALAYALLPALAVLGPAWLIRASFARIVCALAPVSAAALTLRLKD